mgnify:CR=1 FL=1
MKETEMFNTHSVEIDWGGRPLKLETGKIARQADGAVLATYGETVVLATVVAAKTPREGVDFLPLTVDYQEKTYAAGRIPGGYFKREGRPTEKETLVSRLIDRPIRPLFVDGWRNETQVIVTDAVARHGERSRHPGAGGVLRGADDCRARPSRARSVLPASASPTTNMCSTRRSTRWSRPSSTWSSPAPPTPC